MGRIHLQDGPHQKQHHPLVEEIGDIGDFRHEMKQEMVVGVDHQQTGNHEAGAREHLYLAQPAYVQVAALIALLGLHGDKENGAHQEEPAEHLRMPEESAAAG